MFHSVSDSSIALPARDKKVIGTETPTPPPLLLETHQIITRHPTTRAEHINTLVSEEFKYLNAKSNPCFE